MSENFRKVFMDDINGSHIIVHRILFHVFQLTLKAPIMTAADDIH